jgi:hypothetical protein
LAGRGVFHVTDDVELVARAAIGQLEPLPRLVAECDGRCQRLADCCRWAAIEVVSCNDSAERAAIDCRVITGGEIRPFFGFNRAKHAVIEAAILATRVGILPGAEIQNQLGRLMPLVEKTGGRQERRAFQLLTEYISRETERP